MKAFLVVLSLIGAVTVANGQVVTAAAAVVIGAKILIAKGFIWGAAKGTLARNVASGTGFNFGGSGRFGREATDFNSVLTEENKRDVDDCAKLLVCHLNSKSLDQLDEDEFAIATTFGQSDIIDVTQATILYDIAAQIGRKAGEEQCKTVYPRCNANVDLIISEIKKAAYGK